MTFTATSAVRATVGVKGIQSQLSSTNPSFGVVLVFVCCVPVSVDLLATRTERARVNRCPTLDAEARRPDCVAASVHADLPALLAVGLLAFVECARGQGLFAVFTK